MAGRGWQGIIAELANIAPAYTEQATYKFGLYRTSRREMGLDLF